MDNAGNEGMSIAKLVVIVLVVAIAIAAVIGLVFLFMNNLSSSTDDLSSQLTSLDNAKLTKYDNTRVSGTDVLTCLKTNRDADIAIFIDNADHDMTTASTVPSSVQAYNYCALAEGLTAGGAAAPQATLTLDSTTGQLQFDDFAYDPATQLVAHNTNFGNTQKKGDNEYVSQKGSYYSMVVYNKADGAIEGILFRKITL